MGSNIIAVHVKNSSAQYQAGFVKGTMKNSIYCICFIIIMMLIGCAEKEDSANKSAAKSEEGIVLAQINSGSIRMDVFKDYLKSRSNFRRSFSKEDLKNLVDEMVVEEVLYKEAKRLGFDQDPKIRRNIMQMVNQKFLDEKVNRKVWDRKISDEEFKAYYEDHYNEYRNPEQIRLSDIYIAIP